MDAAERFTPSVTADRWVLVCTILASSMGFLDGAALNVALPALQASLNATGSQLLWVLSAYLLFLSSLILVGGALGDRYGRKRMFGAGIVLFTAASAACGLAPTIEVLLVSRAAQGVGAALLVPGSLSIITSYFDGPARGEAIGTWSAFSSVAVLLGPVVGGVLTQAGWWRGVFFLNLPLAAFALFLLARYVPESRDEGQSGRLDIAGALLATLALAGITYGFIQASEAGMTPGNAAALLVGFGLLVAFFRVERRAEAPMVPLSLFRSRVFSAANLLTLFLYSGLGAFFFLFPLNLIQTQAYPPDTAALAMLPVSILLLVLSRWAGRQAGERGARTYLIVGPFLAGAGFTLLALPGLTGGPPHYWSSYLPAVILVGVGLGITVAPLTTAVMNAVPQRRAGTASGVNNAVARTANTLAVALIGGLMLVAFSGAVGARTADLDLPDEARDAVSAAARNLGNAAVPDSVPQAAVEDVQLALDLAFVDAFRAGILTAAALAFASALVAWRGLRPGPQSSPA